MTSPISSHGSFGALSSFTDNLADRVHSLVTAVCAEPDVKAAVEANHDDNQWWPRYVADWRIRMLVAGWSTRVSYAMIDTYASVVKTADTTGWDRLTNIDGARWICPDVLTGSAHLVDLDTTAFVGVRHGS